MLKAKNTDNYQSNRILFTFHKFNQLKLFYISFFLENFRLLFETETDRIFRFPPRLSPRKTIIHSNVRVKLFLFETVAAESIKYH
jgi:hypothetical protein